MTKQEIIAATAEHVRKKFIGENTGHDWWHMHRVWQLSKTIAKSEPEADLYIVELGALLHDIADWKFHGGDEEAGPKAARAWLQSLNVDEDIIMQIEDIIRTVSFKGAGVASNMKTLEGKIIHDADKIDALGAIGIARTFAYGGAHQRPMHDPERTHESHASFAEYQKSESPSVAHFYEKLLLLKDRMYTESAKKIAAQRHVYMEQFLQEFYNEWDGKA